MAHLGSKKRFTKTVKPGGDVRAFRGLSSAEIVSLTREAVTVLSSAIKRPDCHEMLPTWIMTLTEFRTCFGTICLH